MKHHPPPPRLSKTRPPWRFSTNLPALLLLTILLHAHSAHAENELEPPQAAEEGERGQQVVEEELVSEAPSAIPLIEEGERGQQNGAEEAVGGGDRAPAPSPPPTRIELITAPPEGFATGRLNQFSGFFTPRPLPSNAQFTFESVWAAWSAWSFCSNREQMRVRACNTVKGFSCLGANLERRPCGAAPRPRLAASHGFRPAVDDRDYDGVDPWLEDRMEAIRQLYPDSVHDNFPAARPQRVWPQEGEFVGRQVHSGGRTVLLPPLTPQTQMASGYAADNGFGYRASGVRAESELAAPPPLRPLPTSVDAHRRADAGPPSVLPVDIFGSKSHVKAQTSEKSDVENTTDTASSPRPPTTGTSTTAAVETVKPTTSPTTFNLQTTASTSTTPATTRTSSSVTAAESPTTSSTTTVATSPAPAEISTTTSTVASTETSSTTTSSPAPTETFTTVPTTTTSPTTTSTVASTSTTSTTRAPVRTKALTATTTSQSSTSTTSTSTTTSTTSTSSTMTTSSSIGTSASAPKHSTATIGIKSTADASLRTQTVKSTITTSTETPIKHGSHSGEMKAEDVIDSETVPIETDTAVKAMKWMLANMSLVAETLERQSKSPVVLDGGSDSLSSMLHSGESPIGEATNNAQEESVNRNTLPKSAGVRQESPIGELHSLGPLKALRRFHHKPGSGEAKSQPLVQPTPPSTHATSERPKVGDRKGKTFPGETDSHPLQRIEITLEPVTPVRSVTPAPTVDEKTQPADDDEEETKMRNDLASLRETMRQMENELKALQDLEEEAKTVTTAPAKVSSIAASSTTTSILQPSSPPVTSISTSSSSPPPSTTTTSATPRARAASITQVPFTTTTPASTTTTTYNSLLDAVERARMKAMNLDLVPRDSAPSGVSIARSTTSPRSQLEKTSGEILPINTIRISVEPRVATWSDWGEWGECFCDRQVRTRACNYDPRHPSKGCTGRSFESRPCASSKPCPKARDKRPLPNPTNPLHATPPQSKSRHTFYTLAPPRGLQRSRALFIPSPLAVAKSEP